MPFGFNNNRNQFGFSPRISSFQQPRRSLELVPNSNIQFSFLPFHFFRIFEEVSVSPKCEFRKKGQITRETILPSFVSYLESFNNEHVLFE